MKKVKKLERVDIGSQDDIINKVVEIEDEIIGDIDNIIIKLKGLVSYIESVLENKGE